MKQFVSIIFLILPLQALSLEVEIFDKQIKLPDTFTLATKPKKLRDLGTRLLCHLEDITSFELNIEGECRYDVFFVALNEEVEKVEVDQEEYGVRYIEFHLKDRYKGTPFYSRVITDKYNCLIVTGTSLKAIKQTTKSLWLKN